jgi:hypothetical protein
MLVIQITRDPLKSGPTDSPETPIMVGVFKKGRVLSGKGVEAYFTVRQLQPLLDKWGCKTPEDLDGRELSRIPGTPWIDVFKNELLNSVL